MDTLIYILTLVIAAFKFLHVISVIGEMHLKIDFKIAARR